MTGLWHAADDDPHGALPTNGDLTSTLLPAASSQTS